LFMQRELEELEEQAMAESEGEEGGEDWYS
jgi:hypothetical protein